MAQPVKCIDVRFELVGRLCDADAAGAIEVRAGGSAGREERLPAHGAESRGRRRRGNDLGRVAQAVVGDVGERVDDVIDRAAHRGGSASD